MERRAEERVESAEAEVEVERSWEESSNATRACCAICTAELVGWVEEDILCIVDLLLLGAEGVQERERGGG